MATIISTKTSGVGGLEVTGDASGVLQLASNNGTTAVTVDASQNVGIGTSSPIGGSLLSVNGSVGTASNNLYQPQYQAFGATSTAGSAPYTILSRARGTIASPTAITSGDSLGTLLFQGHDGTSYTNGAMVYAVSDAAVTTGNPKAALVFGSGNNTERMRIDSSGNVIVGTTSPIDSAKFSVYASSAVAYSGQTTGTNDFFWVQANTSGTTSQSIYVMPFRFGSGNAFKGAIYYNGSTGLMEYQGTSDYRAKENIIDAPNQLDIVNKVKVREFLMKGSTERILGFVAHELQETIPTAVNGEKDAVDENDEAVMQTVNQQYLIPVLVKAIQELKAIVDTQAERIAVLENKIV